MPATVLDLEHLRGDLPDLRARYRSAAPFPHIVLDDFLDPGTAKEATTEFPPLDGARWNTYSHANERKFSHTDPTTWGPTLQAVLAELQSDGFVAFLSELTGIDDLRRDDALEGGGLHQSVAGGFLNIHADFTVHPEHRNWRRRVNLLLYLNEGWKPEYGGDLELWRTDMSRCEKTVAPLANRVVVFTTDADSFHGHPEPMTCPPGVARQSLALYYFTEEERPFVRSTEYRSRPGDGARGAIIYLDKQALRGFDWARRHLGISGRSAERLLGSVERLTRWRQRKRDGGGPSGSADGHHDPGS